MTEHARLNRYADFRLRGVLGMVAGVRHTACHQRSAIGLRRRVRLSRRLLFRITASVGLPDRGAVGARRCPSPESEWSDSTPRVRAARSVSR